MNKEKHIEKIQAKCYNANMANRKKNREDKNKSLRLIRLEKAIKNLNYPNVEKLMEELNISRRTVLRDIKNLQTKFNVPIEYDYEKKGYHFTDESFFIDNALISESEFVAVTCILPLLESYSATPLWDPLEKVYNAISRMLPSQIEVKTSLLNDIEFIPDPHPIVDNKIFEKICQAIRSHKTISFNYKSIKDIKYSGHKINPYKIYCFKGSWYLLGFCLKNNDYRVYNICRMKKVSLLESFVPDPEFKEKNHIDLNFGIWNNNIQPVKVELEFDKSINTYILERTWHKNQTCKQKKDGSVYLTFETNQIQEVLHWLLSLGSSAKILNPPELRESYKAEVKKMLANTK